MAAPGSVAWLLRSIREVGVRVRVRVRVTLAAPGAGGVAAQVDRAPGAVPLMAATALVLWAWRVTRSRPESGAKGGSGDAAHAARPPGGRGGGGERGEGG